jgi:hypothetical protein
MKPEVTEDFAESGRMRYVAVREPVQSRCIGRDVAARVDRRLEYDVIWWTQQSDVHDDACVRVTLR